MTEIEEVAIAMIPEYLKMLKEEGKAPSVTGICAFVLMNMSDTESFNVMDGVANYMANAILTIPRLPVKAGSERQSYSSNK